MENTRKNILDLEMFNNVNHFTGLDRSNLIAGGDYVPFVIKQLWFRSVYNKGRVESEMTVSMEDIVRYKLCVFCARVFDNENKMLAMGYGSASTDEESFIEVAERRAIGKALANAGFVWHNGDFTNDIDVAASHLALYNSFINRGTFDIQDMQVIQLYEDALVAVLPESYGADAGKAIASLDESRLSEIAKNYGIIESGEPLTNAQIKFVYMYRLIEKEVQKKPEESNPVEEKSAESKKGRRGNRRSKKDPDESGLETKDKKESGGAENHAEEELEANGKLPDVFEGSEDSNKQSDEYALTDEKAIENDLDITVEYPSEENELMEESEENELQAENEVSEDPFEDMDQTETENNSEEKEESGFYGITEEDDDENPFTEDDEDIEKDIKKYKILKEWGYDTEEEITSDWSTHLKKIKEISKSLNDEDDEKIKNFIDSIPIFNNFLWKHKMKQDEIVILGDFLEENKEAVIDIVNNTIQIPVVTLRPLLEWYVAHVWNEF